MYSSTSCRAIPTSRVSVPDARLIPRPRCARGGGSGQAPRLGHVRSSGLATHVQRAVLVFVTVVVAACGGGGPGQEGTTRAEAAPADSVMAIPVAGIVVRRGDLVLSVRTTGQVRAERLVTLKAEAQGTVAEVPVRPGQRAERGAVLARLDPRPFDLSVREAEGALAEAMGRYRDQLIGEDTTDMSAEAVERRRNVRLRSGVEAADARFQRARLDRERATIRAPFSGTVDRVSVVVGQGVSVGQDIATVVDLGSLQIEAAVLEHDLALIKRGAAARVTLSAAPDQEFAGTVIAVLPLVDTLTRAGRALVRVRTADGVLRPGMYADVELEATRLPDRVLVPASAVVERDGRPLVFRYRGGRAEWVYVTAGRSNGRETEISRSEDTNLAPIAPGDTVLVGGHLTLAHDAPVRLVADTAVGSGPRP